MTTCYDATTGDELGTSHANTYSGGGSDIFYEGPGNAGMPGEFLGSYWSDGMNESF